MLNSVLPVWMQAVGTDKLHKMNIQGRFVLSGSTFGTIILTIQLGSNLSW